MKNLILLIAPVLLFASCANLGSTNTKRLLSASGFQTRTPQSEEQKALYEELEPYKLYSREVKGKMLYAYKDPEQGRVYVGGPEEHQKYQELAIRQDIAQDQRMAAEMQLQNFYGWGAWSPYGLWWY